MEVVYLQRLLMDTGRRKEIYIQFIDLEKAYDMWWVLEKKQISIRFIDMIRILYDGVVNRVRIIRGVTQIRSTERYGPSLS